MSEHVAVLTEKTVLRRLVLPSALAYFLTAGIVGLGLFASITPSPLYARYAALWHFSPMTLTLVYAVYAFGVLASLLLAGRASDTRARWIHLPPACWLLPWVSPRDS